MSKEKAKHPDPPLADATALLRKLIEEGIASGSPIPVDKDYWIAKRNLLPPTEERK